MNDKGSKSNYQPQENWVLNPSGKQLVNVAPLLDEVQSIFGGTKECAEMLDKACFWIMQGMDSNNDSETIDEIKNLHMELYYLRNAFYATQEKLIQ